MTSIGSASLGASLSSIGDATSAQAQAALKMKGRTKAAAENADAAKAAQKAAKAAKAEAKPAEATAAPATA